MRRPTPLGLTFSLLLIGSGCGGGGASALVVPQGTTNGPHGGIALPIPGEKGYAEILVERDSRVSKGKQSKASALSPKIAIYFLGTDLKAPLSPLPTDVSVKTVAPTGDSSTATLSLDPIADDATSAGRYISPSGDYGYDELSGEITANVEGQAVTLPFAFR